MMLRALAWLLSIGLLSCGEETPADVPGPQPAQPLPVAFGERQDLGPLGAAALVEASGLVMSRRNPGVLWSHNDSGDVARLFAIGPDGSDLGTYTINLSAYDWEDIAIGPGPAAGVDYLYIGDIGDNPRDAPYVDVIRVPEPSVSFDQMPSVRALSGAESLRFVYPGGARDAEVLMVDPKTADIYIVSKQEGEVYHAAAPHNASATTTLVRVRTLSFSIATAGDISPAGDELLVRTYDRIYHWRLPSVITIGEALSLPPTSVPYVTEPQGEAVAWSADRMGYLTVSEEAGGVPARLYFYPRLFSE